GPALVSAADQQGPALGEVGGGDEVVRLHGAPGRYGGPGRGVVREHRDDLPDRHLTNPLGEHDDRYRALAAERVDGEQRGRWRRKTHARRPLESSRAGSGLTVVRRAVRRVPCGSDTRPLPRVSTAAPGDR